ncbi:polysaccharide biosynthesis protein [Ectothiorhodospira marina]|uniref:NDP-sugar epimerase, includes UDP-GlcNAc-inverting 4,6-dehydratase FlaA1 and capsular polysaccharide biosynthesis protein EpsC n=1 Tax=Ectothiorhodospira marina TaxID=1396821 RepID=A0A1H7GF04_9GAMM|nr:nucleoside-diphosphate sugar epimerase/dehydratase [Ectothiorhodospira marina]SEK36856.1 NDP-sugar epimerase, includes UDP-GlcNAc-inverting 4,6-dehydratase FlaA1 and capsular polysaccharide biosynthesis protein EpsC [Ectothiorhodospira marina]
MQVESGQLWRHSFKRWGAFAHDLAWIPVALLLAYWAHANFRLMTPPDYEGFLTLAPLAVGVQAVAFWAFGLYRGIWRFASVPDLMRILKAVSAGAMGVAALVFFLRVEGVPRTAIVLFPIFLTMGLTGPRLLYRWLKDHNLKLAREDGQRALVIGAGRAGDMLVRDLLKDDHYSPVGLLDDAPEKWGRELHGVRILGPLTQLAATVSRLKVDVVLLAMPSAPGQVMRQVADTCHDQQVRCGTLPSVSEIAEGVSSVAQLRDIRIEDLLGRDSISLDDSIIRQFVDGKRVLVTGAGGSIGSELCRQVCHYAPAQVIMVDHAEFNLYTVDQEIQRLIPADRLHTLIGDVRHEGRMRDIFRRFRPQVVLHAAAYKHVPLVEHNPVEGLSTNLLGTATVAGLASEFEAEKFLLVSTDKAVNPTNVMGATKRAAEMCCQALHDRSKTAFIVTRFGNVLGSAGSVVPLFRKQIEAGGPVTVTHPDITRFFMTIPEAVSLILQAAAMGEGGEVFVLDMGEPVKIDDLAREMIRLYDKEPDEDIEIQYVGLRPGEKLFEELFHCDENLVGTGHAKIMRAQTRCIQGPWLEDHLAHLRTACQRQDEAEVRERLGRLVPEYAGPSTPPQPEGKLVEVLEERRPLKVAGS